MVANLLFWSFVCASDVADAQAIEVGLTAGLSSYFGDINPRKPFDEPCVGYGGMVRYCHDSRWAFRLSCLSREVKASDEKVGLCPERGRAFKSEIQDLALITEFNFFDYFTGSRRNGISPYLFLGVSFVMFNPKALDGTELCSVLTDVDDYGDNTDGAAKYDKYTLTVPFGIGLKYSVGSRLCLSAEWRFDWTWTDWIDDCHGFYPLWEEGDAWAAYADPSGNVAQSDGGNAIKYMKRGDSVKYDFLSFFSATLAFKFNIPESKKCDIGRGRNVHVYY